MEIVGDGQEEFPEEIIEEYLDALKQPTLPERAVHDLMELVFRTHISEQASYHGINHRNITPRQKRVLQAIIATMDQHGWQEMSWVSYYLPDTRRSLREVSARSTALHA